jgi:large subunit ribosomal protein L9
MQVILTADVVHLGDMGDVVDVADGYGRNYLIPQQLAVQASKGNRRRFEHLKKQIVLKSRQLKEQALRDQGSFSDVSITLSMQTATEDKLFGSVTNRDIARALEGLGIEVDKRQIVLGHPIKELGIYKVPIKLHADVVPEVRVWVVKM